jgi:hypothetical protein
MRITYNIMVAKPVGKKPLERPRRRWKYNIRMDLREIWWEGVDWMPMAQDRDRWLATVNMLINTGYFKRRGISSLAK